MKKILILLLVILITLLAVLFGIYSNNTKSYISKELEILNLKGYVKEIQRDFTGGTFYYLFDINGKEQLNLSSSLRSSIGVDGSNHRSVFTLIHNIVVQEEHDDLDESFELNSDRIKDIRKINRKNILTANMAFERLMDKVGDEYLDYVHQENTYIIVHYFSFGDKVKTIKYDLGGNIQNEICFKTHDQSQSTIDCETNKNIEEKIYENDMIVEKTLFTESGNIVDTYVDGILTKTEHFNINGEVWKYSNVLCDEQRNYLTMTIYEDRSKKLSRDFSDYFVEPENRSKIQYSYVYDKTGNWTKKYQKHSNGDEFTTNRVLVYHSFWSFLYSFVGLK